MDKYAEMEELIRLSGENAKAFYEECKRLDAENTTLRAEVERLQGERMGMSITIAEAQMYLNGYADEVERLQKREKELVEGLTPFATAYEDRYDGADANYIIYRGEDGRVCASDLRRAKTLIEKETE